ncbi:MAG: YfhO family protein [Eggerthellaceae bacterium]|nr:YfhO family protein [Eggerthellaceae bacterium]
MLFWVACFVLPVLMLCALSCARGVYPFGPESFLTEDLKFQYVDFFSWYRSVLLGDGSLFYIPNQALGANGWGLFSYYLSSPFNLLVVFFGEDDITLFAYVVTALKLGCIQVSMTAFFRLRFRLGRTAACGMALCFTWSSWTSTQMRNPLWLDMLILLPLACYGVYVLVRQGKWKLLVFSLAASVIVCWYTAYMTILFASLYFLFEMVVYSDEGQAWRFKGALRKGAAYAGCVVFALLLSAWTFVPTVCAMAGGLNDSFVLEDMRCCSKYDVVQGFFLGGWQLDRVPQMFAGTLPLVLCATFFVHKGFSRRLKLAVALFGIVLVASVYLGPLYYVWCGFRAPNGFYCRMSVFVVFLMVWVASLVVREAELGKVKPRSVGFGAAVVSLVAVALFALNRFDSVLSPFLTVALSAFYAVVVAFAFPAGDRERGCLWSIALFGVVLVELFYGAFLAWGSLYVGYTQEQQDRYVSESRAQLAELNESDDTVYRVDKTYTRVDEVALNEGLAQGYLALSSYSSASNIDAINFLNAMGYSREGEFSMRYADPNLLMDSLLGVKYVSTSVCPQGYEDVGLASVAEGTFFFNPHALSLGYGVASSVLDADVDSLSSPFERQNAFASALLGEDVECYTRADASLVESSEGEKTWEVQVPEGSIVYAYVVGDNDKMCYLTIDDQDPILENWRFRHAVTAVGSASQGEASEVAVSLSSYSGESLTCECEFYCLDVSAAESLLNELALRQADVLRYDGNRFEANYASDGSLPYVLVSIPNDDGWTVCVNGHEVDAEDVCGGALMAVPVEEGENAIEMTYVSPGFRAGCVVSVLSIVAFAGALALRRRRAISQATVQL